MGTVEFRVRMYAGSKHHGKTPRGLLVMETTHTSMGSAQTEVAACRERLMTLDLDTIDLIDCRPGGELTQLGINKYKPIRWE